MLALKDEHCSVRQAAKGALRLIVGHWEISPGAQSVIAELEASVNDKEYWVAQSAADTLAKINDMRQRMLDGDSILDPAQQKYRAGRELMARLIRWVILTVICARLPPRRWGG